MENDNQNLKEELKELGFSFISDSKVKGRIPQNGNVKNYFIDVEIDLEDFPLKKPSVRLLSINGNENLYEIIPPHWRHLDELINENMDPTSSTFHICCLHNWSAKIEYNGRFIYKRILDWLISNVNKEWDSEEDLPSWRIFPQYKFSKLYLTKDFVNKISKLGQFKSEVCECRVLHSYYVFKDGSKASGKKVGNDYSIKDIDFKKQYFYFPENSTFKKILEIKLNNKCIVSRFIIIRLRISSFKTSYQLLEIIRTNFNLKRYSNMKNIPFIVVYRGDGGNKEVISFIVDRDFVNGKKDFLVKFLSIETLPSRPFSINLKVGLIGGGSLGSLIARLLTDKGTKEIIISDPDILKAENLGSHELFWFHLGECKSISLSKYLKLRTLNSKIVPAKNDEEVFEKADILVITVGNSQSFDLLAFKKLRNYKKPIIWAWVSPNNILQEIVITTPATGCLNCYYKQITNDPELNNFQKKAQDEVNRYSSNEIDLCGNPHTVSQIEKMAFLATQIVSIIGYYSRKKRFKFDYVNYYWGMEDILPTPIIGFIERQSTCFCKGGV